MRGSRWLAKGLALAGVVTALASGCAARTAATATGTGATGTAHAAPTGSAKPGGSVPAFDARAKLVAAAWDKAALTKEWQTGLVLTDPGELVSVGGKGFATSDQKLAFVDGQFTLSGQLPTAPLTGKVSWPGGATATVKLLTATQAYQKIATGQPCQVKTCQPLVVTGAKPDTLTIGTSRGMATIPAWTFTVVSLASPITVGALAPGSYHTPPDHLPGVPSGGLDGFTGAGLGLVSADGRRIHVLVSKSPCDTRSGALVYETSTAVVVGAWTYNPDPNRACAAVLELRPVWVKLTQPLGDRVVLSVDDGRPLISGDI